MAGRRELGLPKPGSCSLKYQLAKTTLRTARSLGHIYVELRADGKKTIFFCTLCKAECHGDSNLFSHLNGHFHKERLTAVEAFLLKPNPFPFNDGENFVFYSTEQDEQALASKAKTSRFSNLQLDDFNEENLAMVCYDKNLSPYGNGNTSHQLDDLDEKIDSVGDMDLDNSDYADNSDGDGNNSSLVIPGVLCGKEVSDLVVRYVGLGQIGARFCKNDGVSKDMCRIWCEWLGAENEIDDSSHRIPEHDFAVVTFAYNDNLGRKGLLDNMKYLLPSSLHSESEEDGGAGRKRRKSLSDPEDVSESLNNKHDSSGEESQSSNYSKTRNGYDDQQLHSKILACKNSRKELRNQEKVVSERSCAICQHIMLPGKDVAALLNRKTGRLSCSSRNLTGAFHIYHISCLIGWILLWESELFAKKSVVSPVKKKSRKKSGAKLNRSGKEVVKKAAKKQINSVFCSECQGTGINIKGEELERPTISLQEIHNYKVKMVAAYKAWMKNPEDLHHCSTGLYFPRETEEACQESVSSMKLLRFYYASN